MKPVYIQRICQDLLFFPDENERIEIAWWLLEEVTGITRQEAVLFLKDIEFNAREKRLYKDLLSALKDGVPMQYAVGYTDWKGLHLEVNESVLIPRPETAELVDWVLTDHQEVNLSLADIGTGSGCIAIAIGQQRPTWHITATDISVEALGTAKRNALNNNVKHINFVENDILSQPLLLSNSDSLSFDILVSNPPYITENERDSMDARVVDYEPSSALFVPDNDPLLFYREIAKQHYSKELYFEINQRFGPQTQQLMSSLGYKSELRNDIYNNPRMIHAFI